MNESAEKKALADAEKHAEEFRRLHKVPLAEWQLAEEMTEDLQNSLLTEFWEVYDREGNDGRGNSGALPGSGMAAEVRPADGPSEKGKSPRLRGVRRGAKEHGK